MREIQNAMGNYVHRNALLAQILPAAPVLLLIEPVLLLINSIRYLDFYYVLSPLVHLVFLLGLFLCFAVDRRLWLSIAFVLLALTELIRLIGYFNFPNLVYLICFGAAAAYFILRRCTGLFTGQFACSY